MSESTLRGWIEADPTLAALLVAALVAAALVFVAHRLGLPARFGRGPATRTGRPSRARSRRSS